MATEWQEARLGDLVARGALLICDGYRVRNEELGPEGIPFVRGGDIGDGWINTTTVDHIRPELADRVIAKLARPGDVAFITKGTVGRAGRLQTGQPTVVFAPQVAYWRVLKPHLLDSRFLFYLIQSDSFQSALDGVKTHGSMVADYVSISLQHDFVFRFPDIQSQRAIGRVLGALDDKIELNRRMNETLEAIARALFTSWFLDFDPARTLADIADLNPESWSRKNYPAEIRYIDLSNTKWGAIQTIDVYSDANAPSRAQRVLRTGDTIVGTVRPGNGSFAMIGENGLTGSTGFAVLRPKQPHYREFVYSTATSAENIERLSHVADGAAYPAVRPEVVAATELPSFQEDVVLHFSAITKPIFDRMELAHRESKDLAKIRGLLLPKLIAGELRVTEAERVVAESAA